MRATPAGLLLAVACAVACAGEEEPPPAAASSDDAMLRAICLRGDPPPPRTASPPRAAAPQATEPPPPSAPGESPDPWIAAARRWLRAAQASADSRAIADANACLTVALSIDPDNVPARAMRALTMLDAHRFDEARRAAEEVLARDPEDLVALATLSDASLELDRYEDAVAAAQRMMDVRPDIASYSRAAYLAWLRGDTQTAKGLMRRALLGRGDPGPTAWTFVQAGILFWHEGDYEGAEALFDEALKWVPDYAPALVGRGRALLSLERPAPAAQALERAMARRPSCETAWLLGDARRMLGDGEGAEAAYAEAIREGEHDGLALARFLAAKGRDPQRALGAIEKERARRGGVPVDDAYAWALYRAGRIAEARAAIDRALRLGTPDASLAYHAGAIRLASGDPSGRALVEQALARNPRFDVTAAAEARALLAP